MLAVSKHFPGQKRDDDGAVLVTIVVVLLVGFVIASVIAASVLFTVRTNATNKSQTQAFIAAESGRDVAIGAIPTCATSGTHFVGTNPTYDTRVYKSDVDGSQPATSNGLMEGCPTADTDFIVVKSTGRGPDGSTVTIDSVYPWQVTYSQQPGGVVTYFSGGFTAGVSHYTGDLVLRDGNYTCNNAGTLTGDLYVLVGYTKFSKDCVIEGDVWSNGYVQNGSQSAAITGSITSNGYVSLTANGSTSVGKDVNAQGQVTLTNQGNNPASVAGTINSRYAPIVGTKWTVGGVANPTIAAIPGYTPTFEPTLEWLKAATKWIDLNNSSNWGASPSTTYSTPCGLLGNSPSTTFQSLLETTGNRLVLDFTNCGGNGQVTIDIAIANAALARDAVFIVKPSAKMKVALTGNLSTTTGTHQLLFVHADSSNAFTNGEPAPDCGNGGNGVGMQNDTFNVSGTQTGDVRVMVYSPCGLTGTVTSSFSGQLYTNQSVNLHSTGNIETSYTCKNMSWSPAFDQLGCKIKGSGGIEESSMVQRLGQLVYQTERQP